MATSNVFGLTYLTSAANIGTTLLYRCSKIWSQSWWKSLYSHPLVILRPGIYVVAYVLNEIHDDIEELQVASRFLLLTMVCFSYFLLCSTFPLICRSGQIFWLLSLDTIRLMFSLGMRLACVSAFICIVALFCLLLCSLRPINSTIKMRRFPKTNRQLRSP